MKVRFDKRLEFDVSRPFQQHVHLVCIHRPSFPVAKKLTVDPRLSDNASTARPCITTSHLRNLLAPAVSRPLVGDGMERRVRGRLEVFDAKH